MLIKQTYPVRTSYLLLHFSICTRTLIGHNIRAFDTSSWPQHSLQKVWLICCENREEFAASLIFGNLDREDLIHIPVAFTLISSTPFIKDRDKLRVYLRRSSLYFLALLWRQQRERKKIVMKRMGTVAEDASRFCST